MGERGVRTPESESSRGKELGRKEEAQKRLSARLGNLEPREYESDEERRLSIGRKRWGSETAREKVGRATAYVWGEPGAAGGQMAV